MVEVARRIAGAMVGIWCVGGLGGGKEIGGEGGRRGKKVSGDQSSKKNRMPGIGRRRLGRMGGAPATAGGPTGVRTKGGPPKTSLSPPLAPHVSRGQGFLKNSRTYPQDIRQRL